MPFVKDYRAAFNGVTSFKLSQVVCNSGSLNKLVNAAANRILLVISADQNNGMWVGPSQQVASGLGIFMASSSQSLIIPGYEWGEVVTAEWYMWAANALNINVIEVFAIESLVE